MAINSQKLGHILQTFVSTTADVQGAAMVTPDGLPLASSLPGGMDDERVSAMSAGSYTKLHSYVVHSFSGRRERRECLRVCLNYYV
jgi:predicted regulator of Ras-like GTPase activity (Roadblock/LC7/MglB family)